MFILLNTLPGNRVVQNALAIPMLHQCWIACGHDPCPPKALREQDQALIQSFLLLQHYTCNDLYHLNLRLLYLHVESLSEMYNQRETTSCQKSHLATIPDKTVPIKPLTIDSFHNYLNTKAEWQGLLLEHLECTRDEQQLNKFLANRSNSHLL